MLIAKIENGAVVSYGDYHEYGDFCSPPLQEQLDARGFLPVVSTTSHDTRTEKLVSCAPVIQGNEVWIVAVATKTEDDINADKQAALAGIRQQRNAKLLQCDWTQLSDSPVDKAAWASYRQALRDLPASIIDPRDPVVWPLAPSEQSPIGDTLS
jgi:hypothetical protein